jgi:hypothetical protein
LYPERLLWGRNPPSGNNLGDRQKTTRSGHFGYTEICDHKEESLSLGN